MDEKHFVGFTSASGRKISVSEEAVAKARAKWEPDDKPEGVICGFTSASGKKIGVSEEAIAKAKAKLESDDKPGTEHRGFTSASGKKISVSEDAVAKAKAKFDSQSDDKPGTEHRGFTSASGRKISVSEEAVAKAKAKFDSQSDDKPGTEHRGFTSASGRKISVSEDAVAKAKAKFDSQSDDKQENQNFGFTSAGGKKISVSEEAIAKAKARFDSQSDDKPENQNFGFTSAGGKKISVSEEAIAKAKTKWADETVTEKCMKVVPMQPSSVVINVPKEDEGIAMEIEESTRLLLEDEEAEKSNWSGERVDRPPLLAEIKPGGTIIPVIKLAVVRVYPVVYFVSGDVGVKGYMSKDAYMQRQRNVDLANEKLQEELFPIVENEVRARFYPQQLIKGMSKLQIKDLESMNTADLHSFLLSYGDECEVANVRKQLSKRKLEDLENARVVFEESIRTAVRDEMMKRMNKKEIRKPSTVLKLRVMDLEPFIFNTTCEKNGTVCIWNPKEELISSINEGHFYEFTNLKSGGMSADFQEIKLSSTKETRITPSNCIISKHELSRKMTRIEEAATSYFKPDFDELDTFGIVTKIEPVGSDNSQIFQLTGDLNVLRIKFWTSIKDAGIKELIKEGNLLACRNLQWRLTSKRTMTAFVQDVTIFQLNPKDNDIQDECKKFRGQYEDVKDHEEENLKNPDANIIMSRRRSSEVGLFRSNAKRRLSESVDECNQSISEDRTDDSTPISKRSRMSRKFVPPRQRSPN